ncbi:unnamed protein product [Sphagnum troendelagicum]|uniref:Uncharacterized protein n=1 Tax=Sphagnum troendelagicum TaxID=128251 RepID=A0ABP0UU58_9BRYO
MAFEVARVHGLICSNIEDSLLLNNAMMMRPGEEPLVVGAAAGGEELQEMHRGLGRGVWSCLPSPIRIAYEPSLYGQSPEASSSVSSLLDSSASSTETESDDDDNELFASLAEEIAHSTMLTDDDKSHPAEKEKNAAAGEFKCTQDLASRIVGGSWLSAAGGAANAQYGSKESSRVSSQMSSPTTTPLSEQSGAWDLLYPAAGEVVSLKTNDRRRALTIPQARMVQQQAHQVQEQAQAQWKLQSVRMPVSGMPFIDVKGSESSECLRSTTPHVVASMPKVLSPRDRPAAAGRHRQRSWSSLGRDEHRKPCWNQFQAGKTHSPTSWAQQSRQPSQQLQQQNYLGSQNGSSYDPSCNSVQQSAAAAGYGVPAVFFGTGRIGRESSGTGVFLPRSLGNASDKCKPCYLASKPLSPTLSSQLEMSQPGSLRIRHNDHVWPPPDRKLRAPLLHQAAPAELRLPNEWIY